jgi:hypothetical protein
MLKLCVITMRRSAFRAGKFTRLLGSVDLGSSGVRESPGQPVGRVVLAAPLNPGIGPGGEGHAGVAQEGGDGSRQLVRALERSGIAKAITSWPRPGVDAVGVLGRVADLFQQVADVAAEGAALIADVDAAKSARRVAGQEWSLLNRTVKVRRNEQRIQIENWTSDHIRRLQPHRQAQLVTA